MSYGRVNSFIPIIENFSNLSVDYTKFVALLHWLGCRDEHRLGHPWAARPGLTQPSSGSPQF